MAASDLPGASTLDAVVGITDNSVVHARRSLRVARAPRRKRRRRSARLRAEPPRRRTARARRDPRQPATRSRALRDGFRGGRCAARRRRERCADRARRAAPTRTRDLPAGARRARARRRAAIRGRRRRHRGQHRRGAAAGLSARGRGNRVLLLPRGAEERRRQSDGLDPSRRRGAALRDFNRPSRPREPPRRPRRRARGTSGDRVGARWLPRPGTSPGLSSHPRTGRGSPP